MKLIRPSKTCWLPMAVGVLICIPARASLVGFYSFDQDNFQDASGHNNHGTAAASSPTFVAGYQGHAAAFNSGLNQFFTVPIDIRPGSLAQVTFGGWFYLTSGSPIRGLISADNGGFDRTLDLDSRGGAGIAAFTGAGVLGSGVTPLNGWTFVAVRYDQSAGTVKLDVGTQRFSASASFNNDALSTTTIGRNPRFDTPYQGWIDNVFFFDTALTDAEIVVIRSGGAGAILPVPEVSTWLGGGGALVAWAGTVRRRKTA